MSNRAQSHILRVYEGSTDHGLFQNYYVNQTVTYSGKSYSYFPFVATGLTGSTGTGSGNIQIEVPATKTMNDLFVKALSRQFLCQIFVFEFDSRNENAAPTGVQTTIINFLGEVIGLGGSFTALTVDLGSSLAPIGSQAPPRKFTTFLVGAPIRL